MKNKYYYVTEWMPNGTNDLLICDDDHDIQDVITEATFGINVTTKNCSGMVDGISNRIETYDYRKYMKGGYELVKRVDELTIYRKLAISPTQSVDDIKRKIGAQ